MLPIKNNFFLLLVISTISYTLTLNAHSSNAHSSVFLDIKKNLISTSIYDYYFNPQNHLLAEKVIYKTGKVQQQIPAITDAKFLIHFDFKNFFNLTLTHQDISSKISNIKQTDMFISEEISFFYQFLFFKINLHMDTTLTFYQDIANIPMTIDVPVNGTTYLNPGSGILHYWTSKQLDFNDNLFLPRLPPEIIKKGAAELAKIGSHYCNQQTALCPFKIKAQIAGREIQIEMILPQSMVEQGFFPVWIDNIQNFYQEMNWPDVYLRQSPTANTALYYEISGLKNGSYLNNYFIKMIKGGDPRKGQ